MRALVMIMVLVTFWVVAPSLSLADGRDRQERGHGYHAYQQVRERGHDHRHGKGWRNGHRSDWHDRAWHQHRKHRYVGHDRVRERVVYRTLPSRVIYREPVVVYPAPVLAIGVPNLSVYVTW